MLSNQQTYTIPTTSANGLLGGKNIPCQGFRNVDFQLTCPTLSDFTIKFVCSMQEAAVDFTSASSATNLWSYAQEVNLNDGSTVTGSTGVVIS